MANILDGKATAAKVKMEIKERILALRQSLGRSPCLAVAIVGEDPASKAYVRNKHRACKEVGIESKKIELPETTSREDLLELIAALNSDDSVDGILVQLPLPKHIPEWEVILAIDPRKDVDGFHPINVGSLSTGRPAHISCTPLGVMRLLEEYGVEIAGKEAAIVGRSNIVGKPMAQLLLAQNATVTICHSKTKNLPEVCRRADILVAAIGRAKMIRSDFVKEGAVVVDVGINRLEDGTMCGDVDFEAAAPKASLITPVPGGVGPMTIAMLLQNTLNAYAANIRR